MASDTIADAAKAVGVNERTLRRWIDDEAFSRAYAKARADQVEKSLAAIQEAMSDAVAVLRKTATDKDAPHYARVSASKALIDNAIRITELREVRDRIKTLEEAVGMAAVK